MIKILNLILISVLLAWMLWAVRFSHASMQLIPAMQELKVQRGTKADFTITVRNVGDSDEPSRFDVYDMNMTIDGVPAIADSSYSYGCSEWITLDPTNLLIKAGQSLTIHGTIQVPKQAEGGYYAMIKGTFSGSTIPLKTDKLRAGGSSLTIESSAAVVLMVTVPSLKNRAIIVPESLMVFPKAINVSDPNFFSATNKGWQAILPVRNDGNIHVQVSGMASLWTENGLHIESAEIKAGRGFVLPGSVRNFIATGQNALSDGYYLMRIALNTSDRRAMANIYPFAVYKSEVQVNAQSEKLSELIKATAPGFSLHEPFIAKKVTPGGSTYLSIQLISSRPDTFLLYPRKVEWDIDETGSLVLGNALTMNSRSCSSWIEFTDSPLRITPGKSSSAKFKINIPPGISGEYYAAVVLDPDGPRPDLPKDFLVGRTQLIALSSVKGTTESVSIDSIKYIKQKRDNIALHSFFVTVRNSGNAHCFAKGLLSFEKAVGSDLYKTTGRAIEFGDTQSIILPGGRRVFEIIVPDLDKGKFRVYAGVTFKEGAEAVSISQLIEIN